MTEKSKILLFDETPYTRIVFESILKHAGYGIVTVDKTDLMLQMLQSEVFQLMIVNTETPSVGEIRMVQRLRAAAARTPVLVLLWNSPMEQMLELSEAGATHLVVKPVDTRGLLLAIEKLIEQSAPEWALPVQDRPQEGQAAAA